MRPDDHSDAVLIEALRRMTPAERLAVANRLWVSARKAIRHILKSEHPDWTEDQIVREMARRMLHGGI